MLVPSGSVLSTPMAMKASYLKGGCDCTDQPVTDSRQVVTYQLSEKVEILTPPRQKNKTVNAHITLY
jgi:hypothetical protein